MCAPNILGVLANILVNKLVFLIFYYSVNDSKVFLSSANFTHSPLKHTVAMGNVGEFVDGVTRNGVCI